MVLLGPDESFTIQSLSAGKPKKENAIQSVSLALGPDFMTDVFVVDTCDHAKLNIVLSYSWNFRVSKVIKYFTALFILLLIVFIYILVYIYLILFKIF